MLIIIIISFVLCSLLAFRVWFISYFMLPAQLDQMACLNHITGIYIMVMVWMILLVKMLSKLDMSHQLKTPTVFICIL